MDFIDENNIRNTDVRVRLKDMPATMRESLPPTLELRSVSYSYRGSSSDGGWGKPGKMVLKDVSMAFNAASLYAVVGPSGSGKTTLLSLLSGLTRPSSGQVYYRGTDLRRLNAYEYRSQNAGVVFQSFNLLPSLTVSENIQLSMDASGRRYKKDKGSVVRELMDMVDLPEEYADRRILHLSGGEQQRVAIARALSYDPDVIIADEPTGNLDARTQDGIMDIFERLAHDEEKCVIIVTHSPDVARRVDRVYTLGSLDGKKPVGRSGDHGMA